MRPLSPFLLFVQAAGGVVMLIGAVLPLLSLFPSPSVRNISPALVPLAPYVYSVGALAFVLTQWLQRYEGGDITVKRLRRQQVFGGFLLLAAGAALFMRFMCFGPFRQDEWKLLLTLGAVLEVYTMFRLPVALKKNKE